MADFIDGTLSAIQELRHAPTPGTYIKQRLQFNAEELSNAARIQGAIEMSNEALFKVVSLLYETVDRFPVNVDSRTYRVLIALPWGDTGYKRWGMHAVEARILRALLIARSKNPKTPALFDYGDGRWHLAVQHYASAALAADYLRTHPITSKEWMRHVNVWREGERQRGERRRKRAKEAK